MPSTRVLLPALVAGLVFALAPTAPGQNLVAAILQPIEDEQEICRDGLKEIDRQGKERIRELQGWIKYWNTQKAALTAKTTQLKKDWEDRIQRIQKGIALARSLEHKPGSTVWVPHFGHVKVKGMADLLVKTRRDLAKVQQDIANGDYKLHIHFMGWITGKGVQKKIDGLEAEIEGIRKGLRIGDHKIHHPVFGWVKGRYLKSKIDGLEKTKSDILHTIQKGDYFVDIPGLGKYSRNTLERKIKGVEDAIERLRQAHRTEKLTVHRPAYGWKNAKTFRDVLEAKQKDLDRMKKLVADDIFSWHITGIGWKMGKDIKGAIKNAEKKVADIQALVNEGKYRIPIPYYSWKHRKEMEGIIEGLNKALANPKLKAEARKRLVDKLAAVRKGLGDLSRTTALDVAIWGLEKHKWTAWLSVALKVVKPYYDARTLEMSQLRSHSGDFSLALKQALKPKELELRRLENGRHFIPAGGGSNN